MTALRTGTYSPRVPAAAGIASRIWDWARGAAKVTASVSNSVARVPLDSEMVLARYEAGQMGSINRSWLPAYVQDARQDLDAGQRLEMVRKARYFEKNNATMQKILDLIEVNVVGTGIHVSPASSDQEWNKKARDWWDTWCKYADLTSRQSFATLQAIIARAQAVDGEIFIWLTYGDADDTGRQFPRIKLIETHRICDAKLPAQYQAEGYTQSEGILYDARGRPAFYIVTNDNDAFSKASPKSVALIPAEQMIHVGEPSRTSQTRCATLFHAVLHDLHDLDDLQQYEMLASKDASSRANIIYNESGELPADDDSPIGRTEQVAGPDGQITERITYYQRALGARTTVLKNGDKFAQSTALRPTAAQQEFWKILERKICRGTGISYAALCDYEGAWSGPSLRGAIAADTRFYDVRSATLAVAFQRIWEHVIGSQTRPTGDLRGAPSDWKKITCLPPRRATVDIGRDSKAMLDELRAGVRTLQEVHGENNRDWREATTQRLTELKFVIDQAKAMQIPVGAVLAMLGAANNTNIFAEKASEAIDGPKETPAEPQPEEIAAA